MQVKERLESLIESALPYSHRLIRVAFDGGHVVLRGEVDWSYQRDRAEAAVHGEPGIESIENGIAVRPLEAGDAKRSLENALSGEHASRTLLKAWVQSHPPAPARRA